MPSDKREVSLDMQSFEILFSRVQPGLYAYCRKYINDAELARDFVQDSFMNLWNNRDCVDSSYEGYLFRAVHNRCVSHYRAQQVQTRYAESVRNRITTLTMPSDVSYPLAELYLKEVEQLLDGCVGRLPVKCREVFIMSRYRGMSNAEIAVALGISVRTVEAQIYQALKVIKKELKDYIPLIALLFPGFL